jgi:hypothetical protein
MTGQMSSTIILDRVRWDILNFRPECPFNWEDYDVRPVDASTACWDGHLEVYSLRNNRLNLKESLVNLYEQEEDSGEWKPVVGPDVNGVSAERLDSEFNNQYNGINLRFDWDGKILVATDFIDEMYVHMGHQSPDAYQRVNMLEFKAGRLVNRVDMSDVAAKQRNQSGS